MTKGNNFESGGSNAGGGMTPMEMLADRGVYAEPSKEDKSSYIVDGKGGKDGKEQKIPMSKGVTGLEDTSGQFPGQRDRVCPLRKVRYQVTGRKAVRGLMLSDVKQRLFG